jgi:diaminohydroxyphosphoribosylaminopyrimidine deaminase / 5-amino-6-(5-phosphoribosylamino)uracil reductase
VVTDVSAADREFMRIALARAERGRGRTSPNPAVGCVIVSPEGVIVGAGAHERAGGPHAEIVALREAGALARGSTLYCTLEPCSHMGRTGPCVVPIVERGVARVVVTVEDPNPLVAGRGLAYLRARGLEVTVGVRAEEARALNAAFFTSIVKGRPWVVLKAATSVDGYVAAAAGCRTALTSAAANRRVHALRAEIDAIAIGSGTLLADDPLLTARLVYRERPLLRIVFDTRLRTPPTAAIFKAEGSGPVLVLCSPEALLRQRLRVAALRTLGAELVPLPEHDLPAALALLHERSVRSLLVEGGPTLQRAFVAAGLVDRVELLITPHVLGSGGVRWDVPALRFVPPDFVAPLGPDVSVVTDVHRAH